MTRDHGTAHSTTSAPSPRRVRGYPLVVAAVAVAAVLSLLLLVVPTSASVSESQSVTAGDGESAVEHHDRQVTRETLAQSSGGGALATVTGPLLVLTVVPLAATRRRPAAIATRAVSTLLLFGGVVLGALSFGILYFPAAVLMLLATILATESPRPSASRGLALAVSDADERVPESHEVTDRTAAATRSLGRRYRLVTVGAIVLAGRELAASAHAAGWIEAEALAVQWWVSLPLWAVGTATLMAWSWRAAANVRLLAGEPRYPPALAAISWAVPLANLAVPFLAVREAARIGDASPVRGLGWWWALIIAWRLESWAVPTLWEVPPPWVTGALGIAAAAATVIALGAVTRRQEHVVASEQSSPQSSRGGSFLFMMCR